MSGEPIEGQVLVLTAAKASVPGSRLPQLVERAQEHLRPELERYRREFERVHVDESREAFLAEWGHWEEVGEELDASDRELSAIRRAHEEQLLRIGRRTDREAEFETALEIREPVCIGTAGNEDGDGSGSVDETETEGSADGDGSADPNSSADGTGTDR